MNQILGWLGGSDQRSDGVSNQAVSFVLDHPQAFVELYEGLSSDNAALRGRVADALEKIARRRPEWLAGRLPELLRILKVDRASKVRFHLAMLLGHLACYPEHLDEINASLLEALQDESAFVKSWAIASLAIVGRVDPARSTAILARLAGLQKDPSIAVRGRVRKAVALLANAKATFPQGWVKSERLKSKIDVRAGNTARTAWDTERTCPRLPLSIRKDQE